MASNVSKSSSRYSNDINNRAFKLGVYIASSAGFLIAGYTLGKNRVFNRSKSAEDPPTDVERKPYEEGVLEGVLEGMDEAITYMNSPLWYRKPLAWKRWTELDNKQKVFERAFEGAVDKHSKLDPRLKQMLSSP